ncbi:response regulator [Maribacter stanieri]|uniref:Response regulator receiver domain-containing protein n=1 Tax=Maribacter stanieri TaxID=440514 RepID=A0A1I6IK71_9FLAO|nr:response regulator [Maribacter stanieri]SFR66710.1 Response regulator receiver domain-containing protein [Maribacter stanieri]
MISILIIEDDNDIRENTSELLELEGYVTLTASNGKIGLEKIKSNVPDLILCDLLMPEMDGFTVLSHLGHYPDLKRIPFVFFSAKSEKLEIKTGIDAGADGYLVKPFELEDLLSIIEKCLNKGKSSSLQ